MNDSEPDSPDQKPVEMREIQLEDGEFEEVDVESPKLLKVHESEQEEEQHEYSSVALSVARNSHHDEDADSERADSERADSERADSMISEETPSDKPLDSQTSEANEDDLKLINETVRDNGLEISEETIKVAKVLLPDGEQVYQVLDQLDTTMKLEMLLNQFHNVLFWLSGTEFVMLCLLFTMFFRNPGHMWLFLLNALHLPRGFLGIQIQKRVPKSHDLIDQLRPRTDEEAQLQMTFVQYELRLQTTLIKQVKEVYGRVQFKLRAYFILTVLCVILDTAGFIVQLKRLAELEGDEQADVLLITGCYAFLVIDFFYAFWVKNVSMNLPARLSKYSTAAMLGFGNNFKRTLGVQALKARDLIQKGGQKASLGAKKMAGMYKQKRRGQKKSGSSIGREIELQEIRHQS